MIPDNLPHRIWQELARATQDRHHDWRTPVLATVGVDQCPNARTVVLRQARESVGELTFFTDGRSPKVAELQAQPQAMLVFWSARLRWQLRVSARFEVLTCGPEVDAAWARVGQSAAACDYLTAQPPGQPWAEGELGPTPAGTGAHHLAVVLARVQAMDWLALGLDGQHRRARIEGQAVTLLTP
ncbi:MAG: pyridoxamine 5'-phosphate oxidase family protein [Hydrogenophaga sp.]|uniref:pyridoxamine 5'-phosphate oxidase family protein n=1 Tax=Hydrogenophaga sp. TaxID=1904254 RepID=UPI0027618621|nr:pyridoxamine 5'-phosphate oxidase family protein [Hydrogenophaga sp.]MDP2416408.1 pyridoxamine 5'-phosphate oxidase family protein [Hydrogenophaga sp.]MDZ4189035.1 pyridoxamine 5'-phosphate oxidase family protein [Hydrogenophaga sp.]